MPKIIFTSRFIKGGAHAGGLLKYMATRDGVELPRIINGTRPATQNQRKLISEVIRAVPEAEELFEYQNYVTAPTVENASALISTAFEQNPALWDSVRNYVEYIARRPGAQKSALSGHGLWSGSDEPIKLASVVDEVTNHKGNLWTHVVSLRREDAERMGYNNAETWRNLVLEQLPNISDAMKIPMSDLRWYAAYHDKDSNPHIHLLVYSSDPTRGYLTEPGIEKVCSSFARSIYKDEFMHIYERKDMVRSRINEFATERLKELVYSFDDGNPLIAQMFVSLGEQLQQTKGIKQYGYLKPALKQQVDDIVKRLAADPRIDEMYRHWCELTTDVKRIYTNKIDAPPPLEHEKTFRTIKNIIINQAILSAEAENLESVENIGALDVAEPEAEYENAADGANRPTVACVQNDSGVHGASPDLSHHTGTLLRSLARLIQSDYEQQRRQYEHAIDRKLMAKIRRKQQDMGQRFE